MTILKKLKNMKLKSLLLLALVGVVTASATLALIVERANDVTNTFDVLTHDTEIEEDIETHLVKKVSIKNNGDEAFVRMRVVSSPEEIITYTLTEPEGVNNWSDEQPDGFYYYMGKVAADGKTTVATITIDDPSKNDPPYTEPFEVTVYEESVAAIDVNNEDLTTIKGLFETIEDNK